MKHQEKLISIFCFHFFFPTSYFFFFLLFFSPNQTQPYERSATWSKMQLILINITFFFLACLISCK